MTLFAFLSLIGLISPLEQIQEGDFEAAYVTATQRLEELPCDRDALKAYETIGLVWTSCEEKLADVLFIYQTLHHCDPHNPDILFYYGRVLARAGQWDQAEIILQECLAIVPDYADAEIQLGILYLWEGQWDQAEDLFMRHPNRLEAQEGLARVYQVKGDEEKAQACYRQILKKDSQNYEARRQLARSLMAQRRFQEAQEEYALFIQNEFVTEQDWMEYFNTKS